MYLANLYSLNNNASIHSTSHVLKKFVNELKIEKNSSILELGTGDGRATVETLLPILQNCYKELVLSDKSEEMVEHARRMERLAGMKFVLLDVEKEDVVGDWRKRFDYVFSFNMFHFVKNTRTSLKNIYDMLTPGGRVYCSFISHTPCDFAWTELAKHSKWSKYDSNTCRNPYYNNPRICEIYLEHLVGCGFKDVVVRSDEYVHYFSSEDEFKNLMKSVNISVKNVPNDLLEEYLDDYYNLLRQDDLWTFQKQEDGGEQIRMVMKMAAFHAQKPN